MRYIVISKQNILRVVLTDYVYLEFGYDKEALRAAMNKWNVEEDDEFEEYSNALEVIRDTSFLNI